MISLRTTHIRLAAMVIVPCLLLTTALQAQTKHAFSVQQALDYGMQHATSVKNALLDIQLQKQSNREITAMALPQMNGSISTTHFFDIPVTSLPNFISPSTYQVLVDQGVKDGSGNPITFPANGFGTIAAKFGVPWTASGGVDVSQLLFDGQVFVGLKARATVVKLSEASAAITKEQINANIQKVYYQLVVGEKQMGSVSSNIQLLEKLLNDTKELYKQGFAEKLDVDKVTVQLNNLKTESDKIKNQLLIGNAGLKFLLNIPQKDELILTDTLSKSLINTQLLQDSISIDDRKDIKMLSIAKRLNEYNVKRYQLSRIPSLAAFASYSKNAQRQAFNFLDKGEWFSTSLVGIKLVVPIFDGFARRARIETAKLNLSKVNNQMEQLKEMASYEILSTKSRLDLALKTIQNQKANIELAEKVFNTTKKKYEQGLGSSLEIFNAETSLETAQNNFYNAIYEAVNAMIDYEKAIGKL
jgi:hypothetical protein